MLCRSGSSGIAAVLMSEQQVLSNKHGDLTTPQHCTHSVAVHLYMTHTTKPSLTTAYVRTVGIVLAGLRYKLPRHKSPYRLL